MLVFWIEEDVTTTPPSPILRSGYACVTEHQFRFDKRSVKRPKDRTVINKSENVCHASAEKAILRYIGDKRVSINNLQKKIEDLKHQTELAQWLLGTKDVTPESP